MGSTEHVGIWPVGSIAHEPDETIEDISTVVSRQAGWTPDLCVLPGGELANRAGLPWVADICQQIARALLSETFDDLRRPLGGSRREGKFRAAYLQTINRLEDRTLERGQKYTDYVARTVIGSLSYRRARTAAANGALPELGYARQARTEHGTLERIASGLQAQPPIMVGVPTPLALRLFSGLVAPVPAIDEALLAEIQEILWHDRRTVIQFELPVETLLAMIWMPRHRREKFMAKLVEPLRQLLIQLPQGSRIAFHLCWGDLRGKQIVPRLLQSNHGKVYLTNAIVGMNLWKLHELVAIHDPGGRTGKLSLRAYRRLRRFPDQAIFAIGALSPTMTIGQLLSRYNDVRKAVSGAVRRTALAYSCGTGRLTITQAKAMYATAHGIVPGQSEA